MVIAVISHFMKTLIYLLTIFSKVAKISKIEVSIKQKQQITCIFNLEPFKSSYMEQKDCDCYSEKNCAQGQSREKGYN